jgi:hypothetical protein
VSFNARLRRLVGIGGGRGSVTSSSLRNAAQIDVYGTVRRPGPFDAPPPEPVQLVSPLPWELEDGQDGRIADWVNRFEQRGSESPRPEPLA